MYLNIYLFALIGLYFFFKCLIKFAFFLCFFFCFFVSLFIHLFIPLFVGSFSIHTFIHFQCTTSVTTIFSSDHWLLGHHSPWWVFVFRPLTWSVCADDACDAGPTSYQHCANIPISCDSRSPITTYHRPLQTLYTLLYVGPASQSLKHTTSLFSLSEHYILSREWSVIVDLVQISYHVRPMVQ